MKHEKEVKRAEERSKTIRALMAEGMSRQDANIVVDLTTHAMTAAQKALMAICDTAPEHIRHHIAANAMIGCIDTFATGISLMEAMGVKMKEVG